MAAAPSDLDTDHVNDSGRPALDEVPAVELRGIVKRFPGVVANDDVDFRLNRGEVHALLGENGAGKSTLMNILDGLYQPDAGEILIDGVPVAFRSPRDAIAAGLGMVHQHFTLVESMTVTENILIGLDKPRLRLDLKRKEAGDRRAGRGQRPACPAGRQDLAAVGGRAPAGGDPQGPLPRGPRPDHGRAHRGPGAPGDRRPVPDHALDDGLPAAASCSSATSWARCSRSPTPSRSCAADGDGQGPARCRDDEAPARAADGRTRGARQPRADLAAAG